jgi:hypothetical protein
MIRVVHPGSGSGFFTYPGSRGQKGTGFRIRINTDWVPPGSEAPEPRPPVPRRPQYGQAPGRGKDVLRLKAPLKILSVILYLNIKLLPVPLFLTLIEFSRLFLKLISLF